MLDRNDMEQVPRRRLREVLGWFFDRAGRPVETEVSHRTLTLGLDDLRRGRMVAVAGGTGKVDAIASVLASGLLQGLITDERTARVLVDRVERPGGGAGRRAG
jgi:DNA-binding transcriptional regulator LsrR (DeoR family)